MLSEGFLIELFTSALQQDVTSKRRSKLAAKRIRKLQEEKRLKEKEIEIAFIREFWLDSGNIDFTFIFHVLDGTTSRITFDKPRQACPENKNRKKETSQCPPVIINHLGYRQQRKTSVLGFKLPHASRSAPSSPQEHSSLHKSIHQLQVLLNKALYSLDIAQRSLCIALHNLFIPMLTLLPAVVARIGLQQWQVDGVPGAGQEEFYVKYLGRRPQQLFLRSMSFGDAAISPAAWLPSSLTWGRATTLVG
jgi:hypothetical protein